jgi:putative hydrolase of the HAD superfamily
MGNVPLENVTQTPKVAGMSGLTTIGFDADDTLWHHEVFYQLTQDHFAALLAEHADKDHLNERLLEAERKNIGHYGFGVKGFTLSMIETAIEVTRGAVPASVIAEILEAGRGMLLHPIEALPEAGDVLEALAGRYKLVLITKGDLFDQERKLAQSGLGDFFDAVEIVSGKDQATYERAFSRHGDGPSRAMMVGDSLKSDVLPALAAGAWGVHVPSDKRWALDHADAPVGAVRYRQIERLTGLSEVIANLAE